MLDLTSISQIHEAVVPLLHPITKQPLGATVTLAGPEHPRRKALVWDAQRRIRAGYAKTGKLKLEDPETSEDEDLQFLAACTLGWAGLEENGQRIEYSEKAARELYARGDLAWLRDQVREALNERENFIRNSAPRS